MMIEDILDIMEIKNFPDNPRKFKIISYYTVDTGYEKEVENLIDSLELFRLSYVIVGIRSLGSWQKNTHYKVQFIKEMLKKFKQPLVFLDADAVVKQDPVLFNDLVGNCDIAVHYRDNSILLSGTIYLEPSDATFELLDLWKKLNEKNPKAYEHNNLSVTINTKLSIKEQLVEQLKLFKLPPTYAQIFDFMKDEGEPVIEHHQASRKFRTTV
jgi:hypothetical protein